MLAAELEIHVSRPIAPTRRVALGDSQLPCDPAPGFGGILLGGVVAHFAPGIDEDFHDELTHLMDELEHGRRIAQPRLRHRLQEDRIGLQRSRHRLIASGERLRFDFDDDNGTPAQHVLCAAYAAGQASPSARPAVMETLRKGFRWRGGDDASLIAHLAGHTMGLTLDAVSDPVSWALELLDLRGIATVPSRRDVQRAYRRRLRAAHPDHGANDDGAAERIAELAQARQILLG